MPWKVEVLALSDEGDAVMDQLEEATGRKSNPVPAGRSYLVSEGKTWDEAERILAGELNQAAPDWRGKGFREPK